MELETIKAGSLEVTYMGAGPSDGWPCVMCHGFPYAAIAAMNCGRWLRGKPSRA